MVSVVPVVEVDGVRVGDVRCTHGEGRGQDEVHVGPWMLVFVRRGVFIRVVDGVASVLDPTVAYVQRPGDVQRFDHPLGCGDDCTAVELTPALVEALWGDDDVPRGPLATTPAVDLAHRRLLRGGEEAGEAALRVAAATFAVASPSRATTGRPAAAEVRERIVAGAREALAADPSVSLPALSAQLGVSPHHLSRLFGAATGVSVARYRIRLRTRAALERLADGDDDLARLAADTGFADHAHLCRVIRAETGTTPSSLRAALRRREARPPGR